MTHNGHQRSGFLNPSMMLSPHLSTYDVERAKLSLARRAQRGTVLGCPVSHLHLGKAGRTISIAEAGHTLRRRGAESAGAVQAVFYCKALGDTSPSRELGSIVER